MIDPWDKRRAELDLDKAQSANPRDRISRPVPPFSASDHPPRISLSQHPVLLSAILGAAGSVAAIPIATFISAIVAVWFGDTIVGGTLPADYGEGFGYLLGFFCLVMFPCGGALVGGLPGAAVGMLSVARGVEPRPLHSLIAGAITASLVTLAASIAAIFLFTG